MLAHELRNPLAPIRNAAACCTRRTRRQKGCSGRGTSSIGRSTTSTRLIDDLLDVSRITRGRVG